MAEQVGLVPRGLILREILHEDFPYFPLLDKKREASVFSEKIEIAA